MVRWGPARQSKATQGLKATKAYYASFKYFLRPVERRQVKGRPGSI